MSAIRTALLVGLLSGSALAQEEARSPKLKLLDQWVGSWRVESTATVTGRPGESKSVSLRRSDWILGKRFLRTRDTLTDSRTGQKSEILQLMTYDEKKKAYRHWFYADTGEVIESAGDWDEKTNSFSLTVELDGGLRLSHKGTMKNKDTYVFTNTLTGRDQKVRMTTQGRMKRTAPGDF